MHTYDNDSGEDDNDNDCGNDNAVNTNVNGYKDYLRAAL
jgi:hypothetical protein